MRVNRGNGTSNPTVQETVGVRAYGIKAVGCMNIRNIGFRYFYYGCWCDTSNMAISNVTFHNCHYGLSVDCDIKVFNIFGFDIMTLLQLRGSLASAVGVRGDSVGKHLVEITGGRNHTLVDLDADFCMDAIVAIGDGSNNTSNIRDLVITGIHGRSSVRQYFTVGNEKTARNVDATNYSEFGLITIKDGSTLNGAIITTNQSVEGNNPFDSTSGYSVPFVLLTAGVGTTAKGIQFDTTAYKGDELNEGWVKDRICSLSSACDVVIHTASGSMRYNTEKGESVTDEAEEIYNRMDKSKLALKDEVVKTVNGLQPDENGNVEVVDEPPEEVDSIDKCIDPNKKYVLPDGYIYAYRKKLIPKGTPLFTNQLPLSLDPLIESGVLNGCGYEQKKRYTVDTTNKVFNKTDSKYDKYTTGLIPIQEGDVVRVNRMGYHTTVGDEPILSVVRDVKNAVGQVKGNALTLITDGGGKYTSTGTYGNAKLSDVEIHINDGTFGWVTQYGTAKYIWFEIFNTTPPENVIITVNEPIEYTTEDKYEWNWENTGELYADNLTTEDWTFTLEDGSTVTKMVVLK